MNYIFIIASIGLYNVNFAKNIISFKILKVILIIVNKNFPIVKYVKLLIRFKSNNNLRIFIIVKVILFKDYKNFNSRHFYKNYI